MKIDFRRPATPMAPSREIEQIGTVIHGTWETAAAGFDASNLARLASGKKPSSGLQSFLNDAIDESFLDNGWLGSHGRYSKGDTWVRLSFRHSMSLGSDFFDAQRQHKLENFKHVVLLYAHHELLKRISPKDGGSLCSFERASLVIQDLEVMSQGFPIWLGRIDH